MRDDGALVDLLAEITPDSNPLHKLVVDNPKKRYSPELA